MKYDSEEYRKFAQEVRDASKLIDPATAEMKWNWGRITDPYGIDDDIPKELGSAQRVYFVRAPGTDIWVCTEYLPDEIYDEVRQLEKAGYYGDDRKAERLAQRVHKLEAQLQTGGRMLESLECETANSDLADQARQLRLDLVRAQTDLAELRRAVARAA